MRPLMQSPTQGAATSIHVASAPALAEMTWPVLHSEQAKAVLAPAATTRPQLRGCGR